MRRFLAAGCLTALGLAVTGSATTARPLPGYAGYEWRVVAISHNGQVTRFPAGNPVGLQFSRSGQFSANDSVNFYSGPYRVTSDGFTVGPLTGTLAGYAGKDPRTLLGMSAIAAVDSGRRVTAELTGDRLVLTVGPYTLTAVPSS